jgi:cell division protein FtsB
MKIIISILLGLILVLQYKLWLGEGSATEVMRLKNSVDQQTTENLTLKERNETLEAEVTDLKSGLSAIEERARIELGMIKDGETFYQVVEEN